MVQEENFSSLYDYELKERKIVEEPLDDNPYLGKMMYHYKVIEDDLVYWIPEIYAVETDKPYGHINQPEIFPLTETMINDKGEYERLKYSNELDAPDVQVMYREMLGREIKYSQGPEYAPWLVELLKKRDV